MASSEHNYAGRTVGEPIVEVVVDFVAEMVVGAFAETAADSAQLPAKLPGYSTSLTRPEVLSPLHEARGSLVQTDTFSLFCLHECCRFELALGEDVGPLFEAN